MPAFAGTQELNSMKKFKFKLEPVLRYRENLADQAKDELLKAQKERNMTEEQLNKLVEQTETNKKIFKEQQKGLMNVHEILDQLSYIAHLKSSAFKKANELQEKESVVETKREQYMERSRDKKVIEKLKEKKHTSYIKELNEKEQKALDESAIGRFARKEEIEEQEKKDE